MDTSSVPDPLKEAVRRGEQQKRELIDRAGGLRNRDQVAAHLDVAPRTVEERRRRGTLLAVEYEDEHGYPACQFDEDGVVDGLRESNSGHRRRKWLDHPLSSLLAGAPR